MFANTADLSVLFLRNHFKMVAIPYALKHDFAIVSFQLVSGVHLTLIFVVGPRTGQMTLTGHSLLGRPHPRVQDPRMTIPQEQKQVRLNVFVHDFFMLFS